MEQVGRAILRYCSNPLFEAVRLFDLVGESACSAENKMRYRDFILERAMRLGREMEGEVSAHRLCLSWWEVRLPGTWHSSASVL